MNFYVNVRCGHSAFENCEEKKRHRINWWRFDRHQSREDESAFAEDASADDFEDEIEIEIGCGY